MSSRLSQIDDWESVAHSGSYSTTRLAIRCQVSVRQLERFFMTSHGKTPRVWLLEVRMQRAARLLREGMVVKETAYALHYRDAAHFTHNFKKYFGIAPSSFAARALLQQPAASRWRVQTSDVVSRQVNVLSLLTKCD